MATLTRRDAMAGFGGALLLLSKRCFANSQPQQVIRFDAASADGKRMLAKYAQAVAKMKNGGINESDPRSWLYQWYIHAMPMAKAGELARVFGAGPSAAKTLADEVWSTCQTHRGGDTDMFLPWHRMYLLAFEQVIRSVLQDQDFTLPYWDYTTPGKRSLPEAFRNKDDALYRWLYRENRIRRSGLDINAGDPLDKGATVSPYTLAVMQLTEYQGGLGFCSQLDGGLHGDVHVDVGDATNMGRVPTAAADPIFWLHHCNVDRIWAGWNAMGHENASTATRFAFADPTGKRLEMNAANMGDTQALGYGYDTLPAIQKTQLSMSTAGAPAKVIAASTADSTALGTSATRIALEPDSAGGPITAAVAGTTGQQRLVMVISGVRCNVEPGTRYEVFLDLPPDANLATRQAHFVGAFNFFKAVESAAPLEYRFDATEVMRTLRAQSRLAPETAVTIIPVRTPDADAQPFVGKITLIRR